MTSEHAVGLNLPKNGVDNKQTFQSPRQLTESADKLIYLA